MPDDSANDLGTIPRVTLISRVNCHLCDDARVAVSELADELNFTWATVDVDASPDLQDQYGDRVPVVLVDGREHGYWRVEKDRLRTALTTGDRRR